MHYVSTRPVEGQYRVVLLVYKYAGLAEVRDAHSNERWLVGAGKKGLHGYKLMAR